ncbi:DUF4234 domain-containing protein [Anaerococcus jeddahensis]|uniref:DUF4234 domain-containing protein n=1 Tax=Anaerococcus jeddahensis TaxID=1673719 RepID=UPI00069CC00E|nr:DUF4234 domain-containing protein [Anaerococcus jeddahensis]
MLGYLFVSLFNILASGLSLFSIVFVAYSYFTVSKQWNKGNNQDLFNLIVISGLFLIIIRIFDLIAKSISEVYEFRPIISIILILISILVPVVVYFISKSSSDTIYEEGYFDKLKDTNFLKAEVMSAFGLFLKQFEKISSKVSKESNTTKSQSNQNNRRSQNSQSNQNNRRSQNSQSNQYNQSSQNNQAKDLDAYKYTEDTGDFKGMLNEKRSLLLFVLLNIITCGFYTFYFVHTASRDVNIACEGDGEYTSGLLKYIILSILTCGIYSVYWNYALANRLASNGQRYGYTIQENGSSFLLWLILGWWVCGLGYFVARNIIIKNLNKICRGYNQQNPIF